MGNQLRRIHGGDKYRPDLIRNGDIVFNGGAYYGIVMEVYQNKLTFDNFYHSDLLKFVVANHGLLRNLIFPIENRKNEDSYAIKQAKQSGFVVYRDVVKNRIPVRNSQDFVDIVVDIIDEFVENIPVDDERYKRIPSDEEIELFDLRTHDSWIFTDEGQQLFERYINRAEALIIKKFGEQRRTLKEQVSSVREM